MRGIVGHRRIQRKKQDGHKKGRQERKDAFWKMDQSTRVAPTLNLLVEHEGQDLISLQIDWGK